jgi:hypothetical protein
MESGIGKIRIPIVNGWESDSEEEMQEINFIEQDQDDEEEFVREESDEEDEDHEYVPAAATSNGLEHDDEKGEDGHDDEGDEEVEEEEEEQEDGHTVPSLRIKIKGGDGIDEEDIEADKPFTDLPSLTFAYRRQFDDGHYHQEANAGKEELDEGDDVQEESTIYKDDDEEEEEVEEDEDGEDIDEKDGEYKPYARDLGTSRSGRKRVSSAIAASEEYVEYAEDSDDDDERKKRRKKGSSKTSASKTVQAPAPSSFNAKTTTSTKHKKIKSEAMLVIPTSGSQPTSTPKNIPAKSKGSARSRLLKKLGPKR